MDDLVVTGAAGIIGLFLAAAVLIYGIYTVARLMYTAFLSREYGVIIILAGGILILGSLYMATGFWLRKTDRI